MDLVQCGHCQGSVEVPEVPGVAKCAVCGSYVARRGVPMDTLRSFIWAQEGRGDGKLFDVKQLDRWDQRVTPADIQRDTQAHFSTGMESHTPAEFYATWAAYDAAVENMPLSQRFLQEKAEILELERLASL